jgi:hypothetical protein
MKYKEMVVDLLESLWACAEFGLYESTTQDELVLRMKGIWSDYESELPQKESKELKERLESRGL